MTDYTKEELEKFLKCVQKKERMISALNYAIRTAQAPIYAEVLNELIVLVVEESTTRQRWAVPTIEVGVHEHKEEIPMMRP